jgi:hypothetical protein
MSATKFNIDIKKEILSNRQFQAEVKAQIKEQFEIEKRSLMEKFSSHPVTKEIENASQNPNTPNISNTLGGYGNLFGFLGFHQGSDPITQVREVLDEKTKLQSIKIRSSDEKIYITISVPEPSDFDSAAALEWDTRNWVEGIEKGISGFQNFMAVQRGRSLQGIQIKGKVKPFVGGFGTFKSVKYMSALVKDFVENLKK